MTAFDPPLIVDATGKSGFITHAYGDDTLVATDVITSRANLAKTAAKQSLAVAKTGAAVALIAVYDAKTGVRLTTMRFETDA